MSIFNRRVPGRKYSILAVGFPTCIHGHTTKCRAGRIWTVTICRSLRPICGSVITIGLGLGGVRTLRSQDTSDLRQFGTISLVPKCLTFLCLVPKCLGQIGGTFMFLYHFTTACHIRTTHHDLPTASQDILYIQNHTWTFTFDSFTLLRPREQFRWWWWSSSSWSSSVSSKKFWRKLAQYAFILSCPRPARRGH